jgi:hypothetical protein
MSTQSRLLHNWLDAFSRERCLLSQGCCLASGFDEKVSFFQDNESYFTSHIYGKEEMSQRLWTVFTIVDIFDSLSCCYRSAGMLRVDA